MTLGGEHEVTVRVATEVLAELGEWSQPVRVKIMETPGIGTGYELIFRTVESPAWQEDQP